MIVEVEEEVSGISSFGLAGGKRYCTGGPGAYMDVDAETGKAGKSSANAASVGATPPMIKSRPKTKREKKAMPKLKVVNEGHGPSRQEFDTSAFTSAQDLVWTEPGSMVGIPSGRVDCGRLSAISHSMSDYLRGHRLFHRRHSPEIRRSDLSMDFKALVRHLQGDFPHLREREVLMAMKNSPMRCFRVMVSGMSAGHGIHDQEDVHLRRGVRHQEDRRSQGPPQFQFLCDAGRLARMG